MNIAELLKELFDSYKERLKNPILGSFLISTILWNWRPLSILIFSEWSMDARVDYVSDCYLKGNLYWAGPLGLTVLHLTVLPHVLWGLDILLKPSKKGRKTIYQDTEFDDVMHDLKIQNMRAETKELKELNDAIENLKVELNSKVDEIDLLKQTIVSSENEKSELVHENIELKAEKETLTSKFLIGREEKIQNEAALNMLEEYRKSSQKELEVLNNGIRLVSIYPKAWQEILDFKITGIDSYRDIRSKVEEDLEISHLPAEVVDSLIGFYNHYLASVNGRKKN